jgi:hypothetical protein
MLFARGEFGSTGVMLSIILAPLRAAREVCAICAICALSVFKRQAVKRAFTAKRNLVRGIPELCHGPKLLSRNCAFGKILHKVVNLVIGHGANHNVMRMRDAKAAGNN